MNTGTLANTVGISTLVVMLVIAIVGGSIWLGQMAGQVSGLTEQVGGLTEEVREMREEQRATNRILVGLANHIHTEDGRAYFVLPFDGD